MVQSALRFPRVSHTLFELNVFFGNLRMPFSNVGSLSVIFGSILSSFAPPPPPPSSFTCPNKTKFNQSTLILNQHVILRFILVSFQDVSSLVHPNVPIEALGRFLWDHLQFDVEALARGLGRSVDDAVLCVHMVLAQLTTHASQR